MAKETSGFIPAGIQLSKTSDVPLYMQLYTQFKDMIARGQLQPGDRVPSSRNLAAELGVSRIIVNQCFEHLIMEGYFAGKTGVGTFIAAVLPEQLLQVSTATAPAPPTEPAPASAFTSNRIADKPFQIGLPSLDRFPYHTWNKVAGNILKTFKHFHLGYEDTLGYDSLRKAIAAYLRLARGVRCDPSQVVVVTGSQQGLHLVLQLLLEPGDHVWMEDPGYYGIKLALRHARMNICPIPVQSDGLDIDYALQHYPTARMAYVTPTHQFPLGCRLSAEKRQRLLNWAAENNSWILEDDYDSEYRYEGRPTPCLQSADQHGRVIYTGTFSKVMFPGLRLAYLVLPSAELVQKCSRIKEGIDRQSPALEQFIMCGFMEQGHFIRHIHKMRLLYAERQQILITLLEQHLHAYLEVDHIPAGMHVVCRLKQPTDIALLKKALKARQLQVSFVSTFTLEHPQPPALLLGFPAFSAYKLKTATAQLLTCFEQATG
ncbi:MocR-like pyridoxine biosynthesis transcription factor PdxR [Chitinophaga nivalis]|uniref:PLP-dependent aminotransferase family protein n=1 Tax=Chitinophaga nivalis TaxID=2991709 RepID=A0ABT3IJD6_9BACT|nr:PLP-dependent aminotransferase family protein [Chitinophaga nivalis]MCW3466255.1 PLP-dependent aminotransferase family protein [Chitinophaga nivalis]MCW3484054.1 PLP-dependent aminotransferase family protein [Chitinophaga nivalis]